MGDCIFCKIVIGEASSMKVFEDEYTIAFMDLAKDADGHILVIPKKHCKNILDCDNDTLKYIMNTVKKVSNHLVENCGYNGVDLLNANNESAGQTVPHFHMHIIPRKEGDGLGGSGEWPKFIGAKYEIEYMQKKLIIK
ncbi:HIT family protein [Clostridium sp. HCS.1]|uniref:HIT family protein n=1 Tax=Clostridium sp. HCS.1 TaxID=3238594 RepID=UPI003A0FF1B4